MKNEERKKENKPTWSRLAPSLPLLTSPLRLLKQACLSCYSGLLRGSCHAASAQETRLNAVPLLGISFLFSLFICTPVFAEDQASVREDMWVCPVFESGLYGISHIAVGGGAALGYGDRVAFGLKVVYWDDMEEVSSVELNFLARFYLLGIMRAKALEGEDIGAKDFRRSGLFVQFNGGPVFFSKPSGLGTISAGLSLGWRFIFGSYFFVEPAVRGGYPYIAGAGLSAGVRF
jgi:hypothetical protein